MDSSFYVSFQEINASLRQLLLREDSEISNEAVAQIFLALNQAYIEIKDDQRHNDHFLKLIVDEYEHGIRSGLIPKDSGKPYSINYAEAGWEITITPKS